MSEILNELLFQAAKNGDIAALQSALDAGAELNAQDQGIWTALHWATFCRHADCVLMLVDAGANYESVNVHGCTLYDYAEEKGWKNVVAAI